MSTSHHEKKLTLSDPRAVSDGVLLLSQSSTDHRVWTGGFRRTLGADINPAYSNEVEDAAATQSADDSKAIPISPTQEGPTGSSSSSPSPAPLDPLSRYSKPINYWDYIHPDVLCSLQRGREEKGLNYHDEHMFILIHQTFELWFKQALFELDYVRDVLLGRLVDSKLEFSPVGRALQRLQRADRCLRLASQGYEIMETMDPADFLEFRDFLVPASGFQSIQFRELEILMGLKDDERLKMAGKDYREAFISDDVNKTDVFDRRLSEPSLKQAVNVFLTSLQWPELNEFLAAYLQCMNKHSKVKVKDFEDESAMLERMAEKCKDEKVDLEYIRNLQSKVRASLAAAHVGYDDIKSWFEEISVDGKEEIGKARGAALLVLTYNNHPYYAPIAQLLNGLLLFEQGIVMLRQRHARMVEFFIGRRPGTGGTSGVEYIDKTATVYRVFSDLARIRSLQIQRGKIPFDPRKYHPVDQLTAHPARAAGRYQQFEQQEETVKKSAAATTTTLPSSLPPSHPRVAAAALGGGCPFLHGNH